MRTYDSNRMQSVIRGVTASESGHTECFLFFPQQMVYFNDFNMRNLKKARC